MALRPTSKDIGTRRTVSVAITSTLVLPENIDRSGATFVNVSGNRISFGLDAAAVLDEGITIYPNGGVWEMDDRTFTLRAIYAIAATATSSLAVQEFE